MPAPSRKNIFIDGVDVGRARGLEIGPLDKPIVPRGEGPVLYVDHLDAPSLRRQYANEPHVDIDAIHVDVVLGNRALAEALAEQAPFDYIIASHVVEHVPDLVGWLQDLHRLIAPGGQIRLAVPDRRFTFDYLRQPSTLAEVIDAFQSSAKIPQPRAVLDYYLYRTELDLAKAWRGEIQAHLLPRPHVKEALELAERVRVGGENLEIHAWVFTPYSFAVLMQELAGLGLLSLRADLFVDTQPMNLEFFVGLRPHPNLEVVAASWRRVAQAAHHHEVALTKRRSPAVHRLAQRLFAQGSMPAGQGSC